ncbi:unnamed protein product [Kuraishia capsulata CBS 1993]|uniref:DNA mismatch repair proteins mutS family domain-containing protein n=1 Tax=Kuraishia capsulata CBS 1993 TaxID=1382522 RepID=W6MG43_9ASCO|nr:uncharacterized protein KUCA_T00000375001 [Kuraishia capsulata CBS 1993]CDK24413.1 unnamed protein product [Kuraishia capsulata CBS 1993]
MSSVKPELKFVDNLDERNFYKKYFALEPKNDKTLRVVDKGDYYSVFDDDAEFVAETIYKTQSVIKKANVGTKQVSYVTLSPAVFSNVLKLSVIDLGYKVEIYNKGWGILKMASPGNLTAIEDMINSSELNTYSLIAAVRLVNTASEGRKVGLSYLDSNAKTIGLCEFSDNEIFSNLESLLIQLGIKECLVAANPANSGKAADPDSEKLLQLLEKCDVVCTSVKSGDFNTKNIEQDLVRLTGNDLVLSTNELSSLAIALSSATVLVGYLNLMNEDSNFGTHKVIEYNLEQYMKLDFAAVRALNLFPPPGSNNMMNKNSSLFGLLNHCKTTGGSRLLSQWIKQPLVDVKDVVRRQIIVEHLMNDTSLRSSLQNQFLGHVPDLTKLVKKLTNGKSAKLDDVIRIYQLCVKIPDLLDMITASAEDAVISEDARNEGMSAKELLEELWIDPITESLPHLTKFQELIESTIDLQSLNEATSASSSSSMIAINPEFDENLLRISKELDAIKEDIRACHETVSDDLGMEMEKKLKLENHHVYGYCFRLTRNDASVLRGDKKYRELSTVKAGVYFTSSELTALSQDVLKHEEDYQKFQSNVVREIIEITATYSPIFLNIQINLSILDVLTSFAHVSLYAPTPYVRPLLHGINSDTRRTVLHESRHPCLEAQDDITFIANDIELVKSEKEFLIITGPNMGGKSTYIRQVGVIALMAQIGCFVPCNEDPEICLFDSILARVGASDSQLKGVSTFMSEMLEMSSILRTATENSLIIIDELGRGTSTYDGFGLAWAISEHLAKNVKSFTMFATHFHELTALANQIPTVQNLHVVAHISDVSEEEKKQTNPSDEITLLFKVEPGVSDQSFGIHVAEVVKFPQKIISMAKRKATELEDSESAAKDPYIREKRTKCTDQEILQGNELLRTILKKWKSEVESEGDGAGSAKTQAILKRLVENDFKQQIASDKFVKEVMTL